MIYVQVSGGCGNQLFRYAVAKTLSKLHHDNDIVMNFWLVDSAAGMKSEFVDNLKDFNLKRYRRVSESGSPIKKYGSKRQKAIWFIYRLLVDNEATKYVFRRKHTFNAKYYAFQSRMQKILNKFGIYNLIQGDEPLRKSKEKVKFIIGNYENKMYFDKYRNELLKEITKKRQDFKNEELLEIIKSTDSVCVAVRRTGFLTENAKDNVKDVCREDYFLRAVSLIKQIKSNPTFIFFSDEIEWVKQNYDFGAPSYYESGQDSPAEVLELMRNCKSFIMSNSTLSWWAQYLCENSQKIVISPDHWFNLKGFCHPLVDDSWILLKV